MTKIFLGLIGTLISVSAMANPEILLECAVPSPDMNFLVYVIKDTELVPQKEAVGFVIVDQKAKEQNAFLSVQEIGEFEKEMVAGGDLNLFTMGPQFQREGGVLKDVASLNLSYNELSEIFEGMIMARGNLYPVVCSKPKPAVPPVSKP